MRIKIVVLIALLLSHPIHGIIVGSNTVVSRHVFFTFPAADTDNEIRGFGFMAGGFGLEDNATTCNFNGLFPVSGLIDLNGGTLTLNRDFILNNDASIVRLGNIIGNSYVLSLTPSSNIIPTTVTSGCFTFSNIILELESDVILQECCITFTGNSVINGKGHNLTLNTTSTLQVGSNSNLLIQDITIKGLRDTLVKGLDNTSSFSFQNTTLVLTNDYIFNQGFFTVLGDLHISGTNHSFVYQADQISTISSCSSLIIDYGVTFSYAPVISSRTLVRLFDNTAMLALRGGTLYANAIGMRLGVGQLLVDGRSFLVNDGISAATGITFNADLFISIFPSANLELVRGFHEVLG